MIKTEKLAAASYVLATLSTCIISIEYKISSRLKRFFYHHKSTLISRKDIFPYRNGNVLS